MNFLDSPRSPSSSLCHFDVLEQQILSLWNNRTEPHLGANDGDLGRTFGELSFVPCYNSPFEKSDSRKSYCARPYLAVGKRRHQPEDQTATQGNRHDY